MNHTIKMADRYKYAIADPDYTQQRRHYKTDKHRKACYEANLRRIRERLGIKDE